jgi:hypothetical protein
MAAKPQRVSSWANFFHSDSLRHGAEDFNRHKRWIVGFCSGRRGLSNTKGRRTMDWEAELTAAFETVVHRDFPNPERIGCPGPDCLQALATGLRDDQSALVLAHIRECARCFDHLKQFRAARS